MTNRTYTPRYPTELRERGVRLVKDHRNDYGSDNAAYRAIAPKLGCSPDSLRAWCQQAERDAGQRPGLTTAEKDRISVIGLFKAEVINLLGPWKSMAQVEWQTLTWVHWFNAKRLHGAIGYVTPNQAEDDFHASLDNTNKAA